MRVIVAVLALAAAAAAASADVVPNKIVSVYGVPKDLSEFYLPQEKTGLKGLFSEAMIISEMNPNKQEVLSVFFNEGLQTFYKYHDMNAAIKKAFLEGPETAFLYLSAARLVELPELSLPTRSVVALAEKYGGKLYQRFLGAVPTVVAIDASRLKELKNADKLIEIGKFDFWFEGAKIISDIVPVTEGFQEISPALAQPLLAEDKPMLYEKTEMLPPLPDSEVQFAPVKPLDPLKNELFLNPSASGPKEPPRLRAVL